LRNTNFETQHPPRTLLVSDTKKSSVGQQASSWNIYLINEQKHTFGNPMT